MTQSARAGDPDTALAEGGRLLGLDLIRGLGILMIGVVNAIAFAQPDIVYLDPAASHLALSVTDKALWWGIETFLTEKAYSLFSMLFGISLFLIGARGDMLLAKMRPMPGTPFQRLVAHPLFRRLGLLSLFGLAHGALIWSGDIWLIYGLSGLILWNWRHATAGALLTGGLIFTLAGTLLSLYSIGEALGPDATLNRTALLGVVLKMRGDYASAFRENLSTWLSILPGLPVFVPKTYGLMMIGLGLFKSGFFHGRVEGGLKAGILSLAAVSLILLSFQNYHALIKGFPFPATVTGFKTLNAFLGEWVAIGYALLAVMMVQTPLGAWMSAPVARMGRMAMSLYLMQSLIMTMLCFGGHLPARAPFPLYGHVNMSGLMPWVLAMLGFQMVFASLWLRFFRYGPLEWLWRRLSYGAPLRFRVMSSEPAKDYSAAR